MLRVEAAEAAQRRPGCAVGTLRIARRRSLDRFLALRFLELGRRVLRQPIGAERAEKGIAAPMRKATEDTVGLHFALSRSIWTKLLTETYIARIPPDAPTCHPIKESPCGRDDPYCQYHTVLTLRLVHLY